MASDLTAADLIELRRLLAAATNGPWQDDTVCGIHAPGVMIAECYHSEHDAALIAALVNAAPALIAMAERVERLEYERNAILAATNDCCRGHVEKALFRERRDWLMEHHGVTREQANEAVRRLDDEQD